jgi:hypothetical protein
MIDIPLSQVHVLQSPVELSECETTHPESNPDALVDHDTQQLEVVLQFRACVRRALSERVFGTEDDCSIGIFGVGGSIVVLIT